MAILASQDKKSQKNEFKLGLRTRDVKNTNRLRLKTFYVLQLITTDWINCLR